MYTIINIQSGIDDDREQHTDTMNINPGEGVDGKTQLPPPTPIDVSGFGVFTITVNTTL